MWTGSNWRSSRKLNEKYPNKGECALNPSEETFERLKPLIREAYEYAKEKFVKRKGKR